MAKPRPAQILKTAENIGMAALGVGAAILVATRPDLRRKLGRTIQRNALDSLRNLQAGLPAAGAPDMGVVYLLQAGDYYKIGRANNFEKRKRQIDLQLPFAAIEIHQIRCGDPARVELYWHRRFASKRRNGEWFTLSDADVSEFRSHARM